MRHGIIGCAALVVAIALSATIVRSQDKGATGGAAVGGANQQRQQQQHDDEQMMRNAMPGDAHKQLAKLAGDWTYTTKLAMPGQEPMESKGTAKMIMTLDGRFLHEQSTGEMMGMPVTTTRVTGYNNATKNYEAVWTWTMNTGMLLLKGPSPDNGKTINLDGGYEEAGGKQRMVVKMSILSDDHFTYELGHGDPGGAVMKMDYQRKK
jgi:hypothetical protein